MSNVTVQEALNKLHDGLKKVNRNHDVAHLILQLTEIKAALVEIDKCEPVAKLGRWMIDKSTGTDILTIDKCSVIEGKYAHYIMGLLQKEIDKVVSELENTSQQPIEKCEPVGELILDPVFLPALKAPLVNWKINLVDLEVGTKFFTSPQPRDWVGLSDKDFEYYVNIRPYENLEEHTLAISERLKQLNTKG